MVLLVAAAAGVLLLTAAAWGFLREYGDTNASGAWQGLGLVAVPLVVVVLLSGTGGWFRKSRAGLVAAALIVAAGIAGPALAGELAVRAKFASFPRTPACLMIEPDDGKGSNDTRATEAARRAQAVFDALSHPGPFSGTTETGEDGCAAALATDDLSAVLAFYRTELAGKDWTITADGPERMAATKDGLTFEVAAIPEGGSDASPLVRVRVPLGE